MGGSGAAPARRADFRSVASARPAGGRRAPTCRLGWRGPASAAQRSRRSRASARRRPRRERARYTSSVVDLAELDYDLPPELIAQTPAPSRDASRLLVIDRGRGGFEDHGFVELPDLLRPGGCLVVHNTRVIPARVMARDAGGRSVELLFIEPVDRRRWRALMRPGRRGRVGVELMGGGGPAARPRLVRGRAGGPPPPRRAGAPAPRVVGGPRPP